mmetsp:Transcript_13326/g.13110  ORF Transcript_13326/g.13110 Transcript_13326/m.13110 type:complete len:111 (-) Transcript_13326:292-624(-)
MESSKPNLHWPPLESNPDVLSEYLLKVGLDPKWAIYECYGFEDELINMLPQPTVAAIVTYERIKKEEDKALGDPATEMDYYMKQTGTLDNACGIIACIHAIFNNMGLVGL